MSGGGFTKMYLVTERDFAKLKKPCASKVPVDEQVITNSLKAVSQRRKREAIAGTVPAAKMRKYLRDADAGGVHSMTDEQVSKPLQRQRQQQQKTSPAAASPIATRTRSAAAPKLSLQQFDVGRASDPPVPESYSV